MTIHCIPQKPSSKPSLNTFMVVAVKGDSSAVDPIRLSFDDSSIDCNSEQVYTTPSTHYSSFDLFLYSAFAIIVYIQ